MAAETVLKSTYVDDSIDSVPTDSKGIKRYDELHQLWSKAGMPAHKRVLNSAKALERILTERRASVVHIASDGLPMVKTLGQKQCRNNVATPCCAKNRRCESSRVHTYIHTYIHTLYYDSSLRGYSVVIYNNMTKMQ